MNSYFYTTRLSFSARAHAMSSSHLCVKFCNWKRSIFAALASCALHFVRWLFIYTLTHTQVALLFFLSSMVLCGCVSHSHGVMVGVRISFFFFRFYWINIVNIYCLYVNVLYDPRCLFKKKTLSVERQRRCHRTVK